MFPLKVVIAFVFLGAVIAEKKIELQDIEDDNLRNEKQYNKPEARSQENSLSAPGVPLDHLKNSLLRHFEGPTPTPQQPFYIQQYAVTEQPERTAIAPKPEYGPPITQQSMVGYLSNTPVQFYLVPQYYDQPNEQEGNTHSGLQIPAPTISQYQESHQSPQQVQQSVHHQANFIEIPAYVTPAGNSYIQPYSSPVTYISLSQPTAAPAHPSATPVLAYQMPIVHYQNAIVSPPQKSYYQHQQYTESNTLDNVHDNQIDNHKQFLNHQEVQSSKPSGTVYPRYYNSRVPVREEYRPNPVQLPHPSPLLLKAAPPHLSHIPKALPIHRPITKPVYSNGAGFISNAYTPRPAEAFSLPFKRRPTSLLDSYIPSSLQIEYLKRGLAADSLSAYEALASGRHLSQSQFVPRHYERGFLPNQVYHTAAGGVAFGHHKRAPIGEKVVHK